MVAIVLSLRYTVSSDTKDNGLEYSPTDSRIIPFSKAFCQSLTVSTDSSVYGYNISLYQLSSLPMLSGDEAFSFSRTLDFSLYVYNHYYYYLNKGSRLNVSACSQSQNSGPVTFYFIKGSRNFNRWIDLPSSLYSMDHFKVKDLCKSGKNTTHSYNITSSDFYYMVFDSINNFNEGFNVHLDFYRTIYTFKNDSVLDSCFIRSMSSTQTCSLGIPFSGSTAFLTVRHAQPIDWTEGISLSTSCDPRTWLYVIVAVSILLTTVAIMVSVGLCIFVVVSKRSKYDLLSADSVPVDSAKVYSPPESNDGHQSSPSYNPNYGTNKQST